MAAPVFRVDHPAVNRREGDIGDRARRQRRRQHECEGGGGGEELGFGSDLDLVFLHDHPADQDSSDGKRPLDPGRWYARLAQKVMALLGAVTAAGRLYDIDVRLRYESLTPRERDVCQLVVKGLMNKEIAEHYGCSIKTIKVHRARVMEKMGADSLLALAEAVNSLGAAP